MKILYLSCLILCIFLSCSREADDRAIIDESIGNWSSEQIEFQSGASTLHIKEATDEKILVRAVHSQITGTINNKAATERNIELTIQNIHPNLQLKFDNALSFTELENPIRIEKSFRLQIASGETVQFNIEEPDSTSFRFLAMGDIQNGIENIDDVIEKLNTFQDEVDFLLFLGDATMRSGEDEFEKVKAAYSRIQIPIYSTPGNHDISSIGLYHDYFGRANYSFVHKGVRFTSIDSGDWGMGNKTWDWYKSWLKAGKDQPHIVFSHIPPKDINGVRGGHWRSRREAHAFLGHSAKYKVDGMFYGHLHTLDQYSLAGIPVVVSGGAGAFEETLDGIQRHFVKVIADPSKSHFSVSTIRVD